MLVKFEALHRHIKVYIMSLKYPNTINVQILSKPVTLSMDLIWISNELSFFKYPIDTC